MPTHEATASISVAGIAATPVITAKEIKTALDARRAYSAAKREANRLEEESKSASLKVLEIALGIKSYSELKEMTPEQVLKLYTKRFKKNLFFIEDGAQEFTIAMTSKKRAVEWKEEFIAAVGESVAIEVLKAAPANFTYCLKAK